MNAEANNDLQKGSNLPPANPPASVSDTVVNPPVSVSDTVVNPPASVSDTVVDEVQSVDEDTGDEITHYVRRGGGGGGSMPTRPPKKIGIGQKIPKTKPKDFFSKVYKLGGLDLATKDIGVGLVSGIGVFALAKLIKASPSAMISYVVVAFVSGIALSKIVLKNDRKTT